MNKKCVFCGQKPVAKNKEHIIPEWLIKLTGDPNRIANFGVWFGRSGIPDRSFSFDQLTAPACKTCNEEFSALETIVREIFNRMYKRGELSSKDLSIFLDWLDKVRIGLWLTFRNLDRNFFQVDPKFAIKSRIGKSDRLVFIYNDDTARKGLTFSGVTTPVFAIMPSCMLLSVNNLHFLNASCGMLVSPLLGLPYLKQVSLAAGTEGHFRAELMKGTGSLQQPLVPYKTVNGCAKILQPGLPLLSPMNDVEEHPLRKHLQDEYARQYFPVSTSDTGRIVVEKDGKIFFYPDTPSSDWLAQKIENQALRNKLILMCLDWQKALYTLNTDVSLDELSELEKKNVVALNSDVLGAQTKWIDAFTKDASD